jgi:hypothetical protein
MGIIELARNCPQNPDDKGLRSQNPQNKGVVGDFLVGFLSSPHRLCQGNHGTDFG